MHLLHKWKSIAVNKGYEEHFDTFTHFKVGSDSPYTEILQRCEKCEALRTKTLEGHWTLEQINA
jgi:hypothetical protein